MRKEIDIKHHIDHMRERRVIAIKNVKCKYIKICSDKKLKLCDNCTNNTYKPKLKKKSYYDPILLDYDFEGQYPSNMKQRFHSENT